MKYGLIGEKLGHSFSKEIHESINNYTYEICEVSHDDFDNFMEKRDFVAINVTIPYKEKVIPYLEYIDEAAKVIGAVNTIVNKKGKLYGYNTDFLGLRDLILVNGIDITNKKVVILGDGGTAKTSYAVVKSLKAKSIHFVSLFPDENKCSYEDCYKIHSDAEIIINATPCGMYPKCDDTILDIKKFKQVEAVIDVIYNPLKTSIVRNAVELGIKAVNGLYMLVAQAVYASGIFMDTKYDESIIKKIYRQIKKQKENIVLIGMPSSGKSTIGQLLSEKLNKALVDTDDLIVDQIKMPISSFLTKDKEEAFRDIEEMVVSEVSSKNNLIISTGGGVIKRKKNIFRLKANGIVIFIDRPLSLLEATNNRPLSSNRKDLEKLYLDRYDIYNKLCDIKVINDQDIFKVVEQILNEVENFNE